VEFDEQGWLWDRPQMTAVTDRLIAENAKQPLLMVVFAHGWKHNAHPEDGNILMFRETLKELDQVEKSVSAKENRPARRIAGVYIGWRGLSAKMEPFKEMSFWTRKTKAQEVGKGAVTELLVHLESIRTNSKFIYPDRKPETKLIVVGHSFGGALIYSAVAPLLVENLIDTIDEQGGARPPQGFGNLVVLVNPAFEAARLEVLRNIATNRTFFPGQRATLAIFTSKTDTATKFWFPTGRRASTLFDSHRDGFQHQANLRTPGHFQRIVTHDLVPKRTVKKKAKVGTPQYQSDTTADQSANQVIEIKRQLRQTQRGAVQEFSTATLKPRDNYKPHNPLYIVSVDGRIIQGHNGIATDSFVTFLREFVLGFATSGQ
jgi:hypothetical protein